MAIERLPEIEVHDIEIARDRENVRAILAYSLIGLIVIVILTTAAASLLVADKENLRTLTETILPTTVGIGGAVIGFYFGSKA